MSLSDYELLEPPLGEGSFGVVYRAVLRGVQWRSVKLLGAGRADLGAMQRELERIGEVKEHPGVVTIYDFDFAGERPYYAMGLHAEQGADGYWSWRSGCWARGLFRERKGCARWRNILRKFGGWCAGWAGGAGDERGAGSVAASGRLRGEWSGPKLVLDSHASAVFSLARSSVGCRAGRPGGEPR
jgi:hypothetical protein